ncbi:hypothetical protein PAMP_022200 [Pampus punctatissimus]
MHPQKVTMVKTVDVTLLHRGGRTDGAKWMTVMQTDSEHRQSEGTACNNDWIDFTDVLLYLKVCEEGQVELLHCLCWSKSSSEESTPASVSLRNAFSLSIVER